MRVEVTMRGLAKAHTAFFLVGHGMWESLQVQRCIVFAVLDRSNTLLAVMVKCFVLNGCIFLGSVLWWHHFLTPFITLVAEKTVLPVWGQIAAYTFELALSSLYHLTWLVPAYLVTLLVSSIWYGDVARLAAAVRMRQQQEEVAKGQKPSGTRVSSGGAGGSGSSGLESVAQELYRAILFAVFYAEVYVLSLVPLVGPAASFVFTCWLYTYFCFDYHWGLAGMPLTDRLAGFEQRWAFFAGFGAPICAVATLLSYYASAGLIAFLFPLSILTAAACDPAAIHGIYGEGVQLGRIPIFSIALWPTEVLVGFVMRLTKTSKKL